MIILASASPRRKEILSSLGIDFTVLTADTDEASSLTDPRQLTEELATRKGQAVYRILKSGYNDIDPDDAVIISADTVVYANGNILGKPANADDAERMLRSISGGSHRVVSGVAVTVRGVTRSASCVTTVNVDHIPDAELIRYANSGEPLDKAGGYAIQGHFSPWISSIEGCYFNVVGLPVNCLNKLFYECTGRYPV